MTADARYTGPAYPFGAGPADVFGPKLDINVILTSIFNILTTEKGTVPYNPRLGSVLPSLVFEPNDVVTQNLIRYYAAKDLAEQEPRIVVRGVFVDVPDDHTIRVRVGWSIVGDPQGRIFQTPVPFSREA